MTETAEKKAYCKPHEAGLQSEARAVGRRIGKVLDALATINAWVIDGEMVNDCWRMRRQIIDQLEADGWRIKLTASDRFQVLPPKEKR
jgi:hypothetical protein